jgi:hypothetical protein
MAVRMAAVTGAESIMHNIRMEGGDKLSEDEQRAYTAFIDTMKLLGPVAGTFAEPEDEPVADE